ncbi:MAG: hypothetical protein HN413_02465 [Chloroflexi bacterium]|nr:hypothetical protein [Chloroflexota bacterium]
MALVFLLVRSVPEVGDQTEKVRAFTRHTEFDYITWTLDAVQIKLAQTGLGAANYLSSADQHQVVIDYFELIDRIQQLERDLDAYYISPEIIHPKIAAQFTRGELDQLYQQRQQLAPLAEAIVQAQLSTVTAELGLGFGGQPIPPVLYHVTPLPLALIVSPRDVIRQDEDISLDPNLTVDQRVSLEAQVDAALNVSTVVVNIGGVGMYPTMVQQTTNINWMFEVVAHEWAHNYLTLRPLGLSYMKDNQLRTINETTASLAGKEIGARLIERFYPERVPPPPEPQSESAPTDTGAPESEAPPAFDYRAEMHETRLTADAMLAEGNIEAAEAYMEARRQIFLENGYSIRKLNQAWFAFHGAYADLPGGAAGAAENPVGDTVRQLRAQSNSLNDFLFRISWIWSFEQLEMLVD